MVRQIQPHSQLNYYSAFSIIKEHLRPDDILVAEGANTMDIGRTIFTHELPRKRLDAASFGTMGIGLPSIISAKTVHPESRVIATLGDSAFGFSAMECETLVRYKLNALIFVINNNGIYSGVEELPVDPLQAPVTALNPGTAYEKMAAVFGGEGFEAKTPEQLRKVCGEAFKALERGLLVIVNVRIEPSSEKKAQAHAWLSRASL